jgi:hypothetical protein
MIIPSEKILFIHPMKCGGGSFRIMMENIFGDEYKEYIDGDAHWGLAEWRDYLKDDFDKYYKIGIVRNPWDRAVSYFHHCKKNGLYEAHSSASDKGFNKFVCRTTFLYSHRYSIYCNFTIDGVYLMDHVMKIESFAESFKTIAEKYNIKNYKIEHERHNTSRPKEDDYRKYFRDSYKEKNTKINMIAQIASISQFEINKFNYKF